MGKDKKKENKGEQTKKNNPLMREIKVLIFLVFGCILLLSYANAAGLLGRLLSSICFGSMGFMAYFFPFIMVISYAFLLANPENEIVKRRIMCIYAMVIVLITILHMPYVHNKFNVTEFFTNTATNRSGGGLIGAMIAEFLTFCVGKWGTYVILFALLILGYMFLTEKFVFAHLGRKGKVAYRKAKERAALFAEEKEALRIEKEELQAIEDLEEEKPRKARFFSFKRDKGSASSHVDDQLPSEMEEIVVDENIEEKDNIDEITIQRGEEEKNEESMEEHLAKEVALTIEESSPIYQQEIDRKFSLEETSIETKEISSETEDTDLVVITKEETGEGIVLDAVECESGPLPEDVVLQTEADGQMVMKNNSEDRKDASEEPIEIKEIEIEKKYEFPTADLLTKPKRENVGISDEELKEKARKLQETLESFGVGAKVINVSCGPAVTRFELQPEQGVKVSKITALADDIKLNMAAEEIRIEAPIPGKAAVGIEVPNQSTAMVHLRDLVENTQFKTHKSNIAFAVGKDIGGQVVVTDIAKMPHLLIAGATGSGKSVCINTLIMSILYKAHPDDVKLIMIDPKVVELSCYNGIPHLLIPVVTEAKKASAALQWAVQEMTERYKKFAELSVRDMKGYNDKIKTVEYANDERFRKMPQIVIIVDELADLMMVASKEVEDAICRLAQLARAAGIHLVIATQRPSVNVITGLIKANVPSRIAFAVSSAIDSRTILDGGGAEKLLGKGDMLFYPSGFPKPVRVQGAFVSDEEVNTVVDFIVKQNMAQYDQEIDAKIAENKAICAEEERASNDGNDDYFFEAGKFIIEKNKASIGMLQRVYKIGFNRAARIMDQLCAAGVVGPEEGTKPRKILMTMEEFEETMLNS